MNQVERWLARLAQQLLQHLAHKNIQVLKADVRFWAKGWNESLHPSSGPKPPGKSSNPSPD